MEEVKLLAGLLLALRLVAVFFLLLVILRQIKLVRSTETEYTTVRIVLLTLVGITFIGQFIPIAIDLNGLLRVSSGSPSSLLVAYALSNAIISATVSVGWWVLYRIIEKDIAKGKILLEKAEKENKALVKDNRALHRAEDKRLKNK